MKVTRANLAVTLTVALSGPVFAQLADPPFAGEWVAEQRGAACSQGPQGNVVTITAKEIRGTGLAFNYTAIRSPNGTWLLRLLYDVPGKGAGELSGKLEIEPGGEGLSITASSAKTDQKISAKLIRCTAALKRASSQSATQQTTPIQIPTCDALTTYPLGRFAENDFLKFMFGKGLEEWRDEDFRTFGKAFLDCKARDENFFKGIRGNLFSMPSAPLASELDHLRSSQASVKAQAEAKATEDRQIKALVDETNTFLNRPLSDEDYGKIADLKRRLGAFAHSTAGVGEAQDKVVRLEQRHRNELVQAAQREFNSPQAKAARAAEETKESMPTYFILFQFADLCADRNLELTKDEVGKLKIAVKNFLDAGQVSQTDRDKAWQVAEFGMSQSGSKNMGSSQIRDECRRVRQQLTYIFPQMFAPAPSKSPF